MVNPEVKPSKSLYRNNTAVRKFCQLSNSLNSRRLAIEFSRELFGWSPFSIDVLFCHRDLDCGPIRTPCSRERKLLGKHTLERFDALRLSQYLLYFREISVVVVVRLIDEREHVLGIWVHYLYITQKLELPPPILGEYNELQHSLRRCDGSNATVLS